MLDRLCEETRLAVILITHDLGVLSSLADTVTVMYAGRVVETGPTADVMGHSRHPYTRGLLDSLPHPDAADGPLVPIRARRQPPAESGRPAALSIRDARFDGVLRARPVPPLDRIDDRTANGVPRRSVRQ